MKNFVDDRPRDRTDEDPVRVGFNDWHGCRHYIVFSI